MKNLLVLAVILMSANIFAGERVILADSKEMDAEVSNKTVRCSALGYGMAELKINIVGLDGWTILDHSNVSFGDDSDLPCMTAGRCKRFDRDGGFSINDVVQNTPRTERILVNRILTESRVESVGTGGEKVCFRSLTEALSTVVGGIAFNHQRFGASEELPLKACHF